MVLGSMNDPVFGTSNAEIFTQIRLESSVDFTNTDGGSLDSLVVDSAILYLVLDSYYGKLDAQDFEVYQMSESMDIDSNYYNTTSFSIQPTNLVQSGEGNIKPNYDEYGYVNGELKDNHILRLPLSITSFVDPIMNESGSGTLDGNDGSGEFVEWFKGLCIRSTSSFSSGQGGMLYTDLLDEHSKITIYYRDTSDAVSEHDKLDFDFNINSNCSRFIHSTFDYTGTLIDQQLQDSTLGLDQFYSQALGGVRSKVHFPNLMDYYDSSNVIVNKAELIIPIEYFISDNYTPPSQIYLIRTDEDGTDSFLPDFSDGGGGGIDYETLTYTFVVTRYVNGIFAGDYENTPLTILQSGGGIYSDRLVMNGMNSSKKDKIRLKLTFTEY